MRNQRGRRPSCSWSASRVEAHRSAARPGVLPPAPAPPPPLQSRRPQRGSKRRSSAPPPLRPPPRLALSRLTFPSSDPLRGAPPPAAGPRADLWRRVQGCLLSHPKPLERSGENRTMFWAGDRGKTLARWLGTGLLGKKAPALSFLSPLSYPTPPRRRGHWRRGVP